MNDLLEKAKKDYPKGTKFKDVFYGKDHICDGDYVIFKEDIYVETDCSTIYRCLYHADADKNKWAEIIKEETMFKKGDYIVTLINDGDCGKVNYCSKQKCDETYLNPEIDTKGKTNNGNHEFTFSDKSGWKWRFGTKEEGEEYERHGKPYNVTNIVKNTMTQQEFNDLRVGKFIGNYEILHKYKEFLIVRCDDGHDLFDLNKINKLGLKVKPNLFMGLEIKKYDYVPCEINGKELYYLCEVFGIKVSISNSKYDSKFYYTPTSIRLL
jgi:hypothetical protein